MTTGDSFSASPQETPVIEGVEILGRAGIGGMSTVYKATHLALGRVVAIKILHRNLASAVVVQRLIKEGRLTIALHHPNIASVLFCGTTSDGQPYLVMEFVDGDTLEETIARSGTLPAPLFKNVFLQILSGLQHAHAAGIIHRDLKPGNIILARNENGDLLAKIVDFGIATLLDGEKAAVQRLTQTGALIGSPSYMSPERCTGVTISARSDLYSMGCMMFQALTGRPPFVSHSILETLDKHLHELPEAPSAIVGQSLPNGFDEIILKLLAKSPDDRYPDCTAVSQALSDVDTECLSQPQTRARASEPGQKPSRKRVACLTLASVILSSVILATYFTSIAQETSIRKAVKAFDKGAYTEAFEYLKSPQPLERLSTAELEELAELEYQLAHAMEQELKQRDYGSLVAQLEQQSLHIPLFRNYSKMLKAERMQHLGRSEPVDWQLHPTTWNVTKVMQSRILAAQSFHNLKELQFVEAEQGLNMSLAAARESGNAAQEMNVFLAKGRLHTALRKVADARADFRQAAQLIPAVSQQPNYQAATVLLLLEPAAIRADDWDSIHKILGVLLKIKAKQNLPLLQSGTIEGIQGAVLMHDNHYQESIPYFNRTLAMLKPNNSMTTILARGGLATAYRRLNMRRQAIAEYQIALSLPERSYDHDPSTYPMRLEFAEYITEVAKDDPILAKKLRQEQEDYIGRFAIGDTDNLDELERCTELYCALEDFTLADQAAMQWLKLARKLKDEQSLGLALKAQARIDRNRKRRTPATSRSAP